MSQGEFMPEEESKLPRSFEKLRSALLSIAVVCGMVGCTYFMHHKEATKEPEYTKLSDIQLLTLVSVKACDLMRADHIAGGITRLLNDCKRGQEERWELCYKAIQDGVVTCGGKADEQSE